ncbi:hypothetical protein ABZ612_27065 [Streptomyces avermitilis]|uniref:hypothetical protein n=1 Tax=Streptomyces avermitilis TaxID=33903 RepID=UPI0033D4A5A7
MTGQTDAQSTGAAEPQPTGAAEPQPLAPPVPPAPLAPAVPAVPAIPPVPPVPPVPSVPSVKKDRRVLRAVLRWSAVVVVFAAVGAASAYGIAAMERTDVPGLATASDGRWEYPEIVKPPLPPGRPGPLAEANKAGTHYADLRALLLPAPEGAKEDRTLRGEDGWLPAKTFVAEYAEKGDRDSVRQLLADNGLRHIAARGWTAQDGTRTRIYLLQFDTATVVDDLLSSELTDSNAPRYALRGAPEMSRDEKFPEATWVDGVDRAVFVETRPYGREQDRQAYLGASDTLAVVVHSGAGGAKAVPFQQTVTLQSQLLG